MSSRAERGICFCLFSMGSSRCFAALSMTGTLFHQPATLERFALVDPAEGHVADTGGVRRSRLPPEVPQSLPGPHSQDGKYVQVILQAVGRYHSAAVPVVPENRSGGIDSVTGRAVCTRADKAMRPCRRREVTGRTKCRHPIQYVLATRQIHRSQLRRADHPNTEISAGVDRAPGCGM